MRHWKGFYFFAFLDFPPVLSNSTFACKASWKKVNLSNVKSSEMYPVYFPQQMLLAGDLPSFDAICKRRGKTKKLECEPGTKENTFRDTSGLKDTHQVIQVLRRRCSMHAYLSLSDMRARTHAHTHAHTLSNLLLSSGLAVHLHQFQECIKPATSVQVLLSSQLFSTHAQIIFSWPEQHLF